MTALDGFLITAFPPVAVMIVLGGYCLCRYCNIKLNYVLFFILGFFLLVILWRLPLIKDRRYMLPVIIPGFLLAGLFLKTLLERYASIGKWCCGILLLIIAVSGTAKALRFQEEKPYLSEIPALISRDGKINQWDHVFVLIVGNVGGYSAFDNLVTVAQVQHSLSFRVPENRALIFNDIADIQLENLLLRYPALYIFTTTDNPAEEFITLWTKQFSTLPKPELYYEFIRPKDQRRYQLFKICSPFSSAHFTETQRLDLLRKFNLLTNSDFSQKEPFPDGYTLNGMGKSEIPLKDENDNNYTLAGWHLCITPWQNNPIVTRIETTPRLNLAAQKTVVFLRQKNVCNGGDKYQVGGVVNVKQPTYFFVDAIKTKHNGYVSSTRVINLLLPPGKHEFSSIIDLLDWHGECDLQIGLYNGDIELENIYLVPESIFDIRSPEIKFGNK